MECWYGLICSFITPLLFLKNFEKLCNNFEKNFLHILEMNF